MAWTRGSGCVRLVVFGVVVGSFLLGLEVLFFVFFFETVFVILFDTG